MLRIDRVIALLEGCLQEIAAMLMQNRPMTLWVDQSVGPSPYAVFYFIWSCYLRAYVLGISALISTVGMFR